MYHVTYIDKHLVKHMMQNSKKGFVTLWIWSHLSYKQCPSTSKEKDCFKVVFNASTMNNLKYVMLCAKPDICFIVGIMSGY